MSVRWITKVWDDSPYEGAKLLIHLAMADHANEEGWFFAAQTSIARKARCSTQYVRLTVQQMISDGYLEITRKGHSKGKATEYRLLHKRVVELPTMNDDELPNTVALFEEVNTQTLYAQHPNSVSPTTKLSNTTTVLYNHPDTTKSAGEIAASQWWDSLEVKPIGRSAWWSLRKVCEAASERGYSIEQIVNALKRCGTVPSISQMDKLLKNIQPMSHRQQRLARGFEIAMQVTEPLPWEIEA